MRLARERRHTLYFLEEIRRFSPVFLDTEVDMTRVNEHRAREREAGRRYSPLAYLVLASAAVLADHPAANAAIRGRFLPRVTSYPDVNTKITFDRTLNGQRVVLSAVLTGAGGASLEEIQGWLDRFRAVDPTTAPEFAGARALHRLPMALGRQAFRARVRPLAGRAAVMGTVAVTSLGHRPIDSFHSVGGTTVTFGVGRVQDRPVARDGQVRIAPVLRLSMAFDHRVIDGAEAADILAEVRHALAGFEAGSGAAGVAARPASVETGAAELGEPLEVGSP